MVNNELSAFYLSKGVLVLHVLTHATKYMNMKKILFLLFLLITLFSYGRTDKYRLTLRDNPATSIVIGWDQFSGNGATVYYGTTDYGTNYQQYQNSKAPDRTVFYKGMNNQFVRLNGLQAATAYYFVIKDSEGVSKRFWFKTATADQSRLSFIAGGDSRNNRTPRRNANSLVAKLKPHAVFFGGDMTDNDTNSQWQTWFDDWQLTIASDNRMFPIIAARGNHEGSNKSIYNLFDVPSTSIYYGITFGDNLIRTYTLNTEISISGNQTEWLENDLSANEKVLWKMAQYHKPMRPHVSYKREGNNQYSNWAELFYDKGVRLVVECDAHTVKSTWPVRPSSGSGNDEGFVRENSKGTVYVGEGCWGAPLRSSNDAKQWTRNSGSFNQFKWIFVDKDKIETRTIRVDNASAVGAVSNNNVFVIPSELDIWSPTNGEVVILQNETTPDPTPIPSSGTLRIPITNGDDDVEEDKNGKIYSDSSDLELVYDFYNTSSYQTIGLRFQKVPLPKDAIITSAYIQFTADESDNNGNVKLEFSLHASANSSAFSSNSNVSSRAVFGESVVWRPGPWLSGQNGNNQKTLDLSKMLQLLVNQDGWNPGNSLSFRIRGLGKSLVNKDAKRVADSFEGGSDKAPILVIAYEKRMDICAGTVLWESRAYKLGEKVVYQGSLYEKTQESWKQIGTCAAHKATKNTRSLSPPIEDVELHDVVVTPNPFHDTISVRFPRNWIGTTVALKLYNIKGQLVYQKKTKVTNSPHTIVSEILVKGAYILKIESDSLRINRQLLLKK